MCSGGLARALGLIAVLVVWVAMGVLAVTSLELPLGESRAGGDASSAAQEQRARPRQPGPRARDRRLREDVERGAQRVERKTDSAIGDLRTRISAVAGSVWYEARGPLFVLAVLALLVLAKRTSSRYGRRYVRLWLLPHRGDEAEPDDVRRLLESWHQQLLERWWRRIPNGQPSMALELIVEPDEEGDRAARISVVCPEELADKFEGNLLACYPDSRLQRGKETLPKVNRTIRLKKRYPFVRALRSAEEDGRNTVDAVLNQMAALKENAVLQYTLTPTPALFDRYSRGRFGAVERATERARVFDPANPGLRSEVRGQELEGGLRVQHHTLFFTEIRAAAETFRGCESIVGIVRGESGAENRLVERKMRRLGRGLLYLWRIRRGVGNPIPGWRRGVLSSSEIANIWRLPDPSLKAVRISRSAIPRMPAPPEISRNPEHALARDERGFVGIRPEDKTDGLGLIGGQKTGKTSVLCRTVQADALDPTRAMVVLMPKPGDALKALSMIPRERVVHFLDLERPEFGFNPLTVDGDASMVADKIVEAFRDVNAEGDIRGSSDRYLRQAAQAAIGASRGGVLDRVPTLWDAYRMLLPSERAFRERVVEALSIEPRYSDTAMFFGRELPHDLENAPGQTTAKLDAPRNKLLRLMVESLDKVLRHPRQLDLAELVRRREILIVDGKMGTFGAENCKVMMQFLLNALFGVLQRQQQLPESERVQVALKVDEAHLILNESFADALATLRSGGLEVTAAWQYGEQIQDPKVRAGMMSLLRQRCMFSMGEANDAREMTTIGMAVYTDRILGDPESRGRLRVTPDTIFNLPNYHTLCSWISRGERIPAFVAKTIPLETDDEMVGHHLAAQRERGGYVPDVLPDPMPDTEWKGMKELPSAEIYERNGSGNGTPPVTLDFQPGTSSVDHSLERAATRPRSQSPASYTELDLGDVQGLIWHNVTPLPRDRHHEPTVRELEVLGALWSYRFLFASQIHRRWWRGSSLRAAQQTLNRMTKAGWVRRFSLRVAERGSQQRVYCLTRQGFELGQGHIGRRGNYIDPQAKWREPVATDARRILRSLHVNGWVLAFEDRGRKALKAWRGPREGRLEPPRRRVRGEWVEVLPRDVVVGATHKLRDYEPARFEPVTPDATLELALAVGESPLRFDVLVELNRGGNAAANEDRMRRYDGLISGWSWMLQRYQTVGTPPVVLFVCEDERAAVNLLRIADRVVTARLAKPGTGETEWPHPGRRGMFFAIEREIHLGSLEALQLPERPPDMRERLEGKRARACQPRRVHLIEPKLLDFN